MQRIQLKIFDSIFHFESVMKEQKNILSSHNQSVYEDVSEFVSSAEWYGADNYDEVINVKQFSYMDIYQSIKNEITNTINTDVFSKIKKKKLSYSENFGVFSMDRVMMGMQRKKELFCKHKNTVVQWNEVEILENKKIQTKTEKYEVKFRNAFDEKNRPKIKTTNRKIFVYFPEKPRNNRAVEIFVNGDIAAEKTSENAIYKTLPSIFIEEELIRKSYKVQINYINGVLTSENLAVSVTPVKRFDEFLDVDKLLLWTCDMKYVRYHKYLQDICVTDFFELDIPSNLGSPVYNSVVERIIKEKSEYFSKDTIKLLLPETFDKQNVISLINSTINNLANAETGKNN